MDPQVIATIINTVLLIVYALAASIKTLVEKNKRGEHVSTMDAKLDSILEKIGKIEARLDNLLERVGKIEDTLAQEKVIESIHNMAEIQMSTIKILRDLRNGDK